METQQPSKLARLNAYQIAGLALLTSTVAAVSVLIAIRFALNDDASVEKPREPDLATDTRTNGRTPDHFSEDSVVRGFTGTGPDVLRQDAERGRSPEGV
jgi:hypothetical protein